MIKAVVFDLDGTLLNTLEDLCNACNYALEKEGHLPTNLFDTRKNIGHGIRNYILKSSNMDEVNIDSMMEHFKEFYTVHCNDNTKPYDGINNILYKLKKDGYKLGCISNKSSYALHIICAKQFPKIFDLVIGYGDGYKRKPDPEVIYEASKKLDVALDEFLYIGDSDVDVLTVKNSSCRGLFVSYGYRDRSVLEDMGATPIVDHPLDIYELIKEM